MELLSNPALVWFLAGAILIILEFIIPGVFVVFFGLGACITTLFTHFLGISVPIQFLIFSFTSVLSLILFRKMVMNRLYKKTDIDPDEEFIGHTAICISPIKKDTAGKIEFKGTQWTAMADEDIDIGQKVKIIGKDGINLFVSII